MGIPFTVLLDMRAKLIVFLLASWVGVSAQDQKAASLTADELAIAAREAVDELERLQTSTSADRAALGVFEDDLRQAVTRLNEPLPQRPIPIEDMQAADRDALMAQLEIARVFREAWDEKQQLHSQGAEALTAAEQIAPTLREGYRKLFDLAVAVRPLLVETQRRFARGELLEDQFGLAEGPKVLDEWIDRSSELIATRDQRLAEIDLELTRFESRRTAFLALEGEDPATTRLAYRVHASLSVIAEAMAVQAVLFDELEARPETLPTEAERVLEEWRVRRVTLEQAGERVQNRWTELDALESERSDLEAPNAGDIDVGEGLPEVQAARRAVGLSEGLIVYFETQRELLDRTRAAERELLTAIEDAETRHASFSRQTARAFALYRFADLRVEAGETVAWAAPADLGRTELWEAWRDAQGLDLDRISKADELRERIADVGAPDELRRRIEREEESLRRAETVLAMELSHAEFVSRMTQRSDEELLALLAEDGEIATRIAEIDEEVASLEAAEAATGERCLAIVRAVQNVENPYSRAAIPRRVKRLADLRAALVELPEGDLLPDVSDELFPEAAEAPKVDYPGDFHDNTIRSNLELAHQERVYLERQQQVARVFAKYFEACREHFEQLEPAVAERRRIDDDHEERLSERVRQLKLHYAAAREIESRRAAGRELPSLTPTLEESRDALQRAGEKLRGVQRANESFHDRAAYELERLVQIDTLSRFLDIRTEATDGRAQLIGRPVSHLQSATTPIAELEDVELTILQYDARVAEAESTRFTDRLEERFTSDDERRRFLDPLRALFLELANTRRMKADFTDAGAAYAEIIAICVREKEEMMPGRAVADASIAFRIREYEAARYASAVARHPGSRARIEEAYRQTYGEPLPYRMVHADGDVDVAADLLFGAEIHLIAQRGIASVVTELMSKIGIDQDIGWYRSQLTRVDALLEGQKNKEAELSRRIDDLRATYRTRLRANTARGLAIALAIPLVAFLVVRLLRRFARRFEVEVDGELGEDEADRRRRLRTLSRVGTAALSVFLWIVALIYVFAQLGLDVTPIIASASVVGLAVAFGAQALIKDLFYGFFILIENQFTVGDIVRLGAVSGTVEAISLRITTLRDLKGTVHYIPNGSIGQVSNMTQGWSRVVMEISFAYGEDPDRATQVLDGVLVELFDDQTWRPRILERPVVAGVENLTERSVDIRIMIKTRPGRQWEIAREARRRIKLRFAELGIESPFPHRVVHHVYEEGAGGPGLAPPTSSDALADG